MQGADGRILQDGLGVVLAADDGDAGKPGGQGAPDIGLQQMGMNQAGPPPAYVPDERPEAKRRGTAAEFQTSDVTGGGGKFGQQIVVFEVDQVAVVLVVEAGDDAQEMALGAADRQRGDDVQYPWAGHHVPEMARL